MRIDKDKLTFVGLEKLERILKKENISIKVGILGDDDTREGGKSNASIGLRHEFGGEFDDGGGNIEERSFLRMPLNMKFSNRLENAGLFNKKTMEKIIKKGTFLNFAKKIGVLAESVISEAFATGGFGLWKKSNMKYKKNHQTLVETQQLRDSITSEAKV